MANSYDNSYPEYNEGYEDYYKGKSNSNPYPWDNQNWWRVEAYEQGYKDAEMNDWDDD